MEFEWTTIWKTFNGISLTWRHICVEMGKNIVFYCPHLSTSQNWFSHANYTFTHTKIVRIHQNSITYATVFPKRQPNHCLSGLLRANTGNELNCTQNAQWQMLLNKLHSQILYIIKFKCTLLQYCFVVLADATETFMGLLESLFHTANGFSKVFYICHPLCGMKRVERKRTHSTLARLSILICYD